MLKKYIIHFLGLVLIPLGIVMIVNSKIGSFPWDAMSMFANELWSLIFPGIELWLTTFINGAILAVIVVILYKNPKYFMTLIMILITSLFFDWFNRLFSLFTYSNNVFLAIIMALLGMVVMAIGINLTILSGLMASAVESAMMFIDKFTKNLFLSKLLLESMFLIIAIILGLIAGNLWDYIGPFTLVAILSASTFVSITHPLVHFLVGKKGMEHESK
jgi:uncharacterized membrane protein YczE